MPSESAGFERYTLVDLHERKGDPAMRFNISARLRKRRRKRREKRRQGEKASDFWERRDRKYLEIYERELGELRVDERTESKLVRYEKDGRFDFDLYRKVQNQANAEMLDYAWVSEENVRHLARLLKVYNPDAHFGLCHGAKHGREAAWFQEEYGGSLRVLGTDIADSAQQFENVVQWDFHEINPKWHGVCDFVYSNSWDHAYDPAKAFAAWADSLKPGGILLLDWSNAHGPEGVSVIDPYGATLGSLAENLVRAAPGLLGVCRIIDDLPEASEERQTLMAIRL